MIASLCGDSRLRLSVAQRETTLACAAAMKAVPSTRLMSVI